MSSEYLIVYNQNGEMLGVLDNAGEISYNLLHNDLWTASFSLPSDDPKNSYCHAHNIVHIPDGNRDAGLYRIVGMPISEETAMGGLKTYSLEHVMAVLLDDVLFGYHEIGGVEMPTGDVIRYILSQQSTVRWVLGECDFADQFSYKFENTSLLSALLSLGEVILDEFTWVFDTTITPWRISLKRADVTPGCGIHYMRNMVGIEKNMDASTLVTRLYLLGYGEGVNQLTIKDVNGGLPYINADTVNTWGVKCSIYVDPRIEDAVTLKARGRAILEKLKNPYVSYTASAIDLARVTGQSWDTFMPGKLVKVMDGEHGVDFNARIVSVVKEDLGGRPGDIEITIANAEHDAATSINTLADRLGINELYSQGATNLYSQQYADNADTAHPAIMRVFVPQGCVRINQMLLSWQTEPFRAYETGASAGGATATTTSNGGASTSTSSAGGGSEKTSSADGNATVTTETKITNIDVAVGGPRASDTGLEIDYTVAGGDDASTAVGGSGNISINNLSVGGPLDSATGTSKDDTDAGGSGNTGSGGSGSVSTENVSVGRPLSSASGANMDNTDSAGSGSTGSSSGSTGSGGGDSTGGTSLTTLGVSVLRTGSADGVTESHTHSHGHTHNIGGHTHTQTSHSHSLNSHTHSGASHSHYFRHYHTGAVTISLPSHTHTIGSHSHYFRHYHTGAAGFALPGHTHTMGTHSHYFRHYHTGKTSVTIPALSVSIPSHTHSVKFDAHTHNVTIPAHNHDLTLNDHTHGIIYGIYEGERATSITLMVDGFLVPSEAVHSRDMDIVAYLAKDEDGKIRRGTWHEIRIVPNCLTRIEANLFVQTFIQSIGGGDY